MVNKKIIVLVAIVLAAVMLLATGCQSVNDKSGGAGTEANNSSNKDVNSGNTNNGDTSLLPKGVALTYWTSFTGGAMAKSPDETVYYKTIQEKTGVPLKFVGGSSASSEQLALLISSGDVPDIIEDYWNNFPGGIMKALNDGVIIPLNDLMKSGHLPNFSAYLASDPEADKLCKTDDGRYYSVPMIRAADSYLVFNGNIIRKDWLDDLGLEVPKTIKQMEDVLLAFKEKKGATAGYTVAWNNDSLMVYAFGVVDGFYVDENNKVQYGPLQDGYKDFLTLFNEWNKKGILDPDLYTQDYDTFIAKIASGKTGLVWGNTGGELGKIATIEAKNPGMKWIPAPNPVLTEGEPFPVDKSACRVNTIGSSISSSCKYPEAAAKVIDYVYSKEGIMLSNFGVEGVTYTTNSEGLPEFTKFVTNNPDGYSVEEVWTQYAGPKNKTFLNTKRYMDLTYTLDTQKESLELWKSPNAKRKPLPTTVTLTPEETQEYTEIMNEINTYVQEMKLKFIMGTEPISNYDAFRQNLKSMNIDRAIAIQQAAYDRFLAR